MNTRTTLLTAALLAAGLVSGAAQATLIDPPRRTTMKRTPFIALLMAILLVVFAVPSLALPINLPPVANAGGNQSMYTGDVAYLNGTATDAENDPIQWWWWNVVDFPVGSIFTLYAEYSQNAVFQASTAGSYLFSLIVDDGFSTSAPDTIFITVADNLPPVAIATADLTYGPAPFTVQFDGSQSYDPEGKPLIEYFWDFGDGTLGAYGPVPPPHTYSIPGTYNVVILGVTDERGAVGSDVLVINVNVPESVPEPGSIALLGLGLAGLSWVRRRGATHAAC